MGEWHGHGKTGLCVGFRQHGYFKEEGHCEHLRIGQAAFGYSSKKVGEQELMLHLKCEPCFEAYLKVRNNEAVCCNDCTTYMPRSATQLYVPYSRDGLSEEEAQLTICMLCWEEEKHQDRLAEDRENQMLESDGDETNWDPGLGLECADEPVVSEVSLECSDCGNEFHLAQLKVYIPADRGEGNIADLTLHLCNECVNEPRHQGRLLEDRHFRMERNPRSR